MQCREKSVPKRCSARAELYLLLSLFSFFTFALLSSLLKNTISNRPKPVGVWCLS